MLSRDSTVELDFICGTESISGLDLTGWNLPVLDVDALLYVEDPGG